MTELRKCPFCGGEASVYEHKDWDSFFVMCECCGCTIGTALDNIACSEEEIVELWNRRVGEDK